MVVGGGGGGGGFGWGQAVFWEGREEVARRERVLERRGEVFGARRLPRREEGLGGFEASAGREVWAGRF